MVGRINDAMRLRQEVFSETLKLFGEEHSETLIEANNYVCLLIELDRFEEVKLLLRKPMPLAQRVFEDSHELTLRMRWAYATVLYKDDGATLDDIREAVETFKDLEPTARHVLGGSHPFTTSFMYSLRKSCAALRAREMPSGSSEVLQTADDLAAHFG